MNLRYLNAEVLIWQVYSKNHRVYLEEPENKPICLFSLSNVTSQICHCYFALSVGNRSILTALVYVQQNCLAFMLVTK